MAQVWVDCSYIMGKIEEFEAELASRKDEIDALSKKIYAAQDECWALWDRHHLGYVPECRDPGKNRLRVTQMAAISMKNLCSKSADGRVFMSETDVTAVDGFVDSVKRHINDEIHHLSVINYWLERHSKPEPVVDEPEPRNESGAAPLIFVMAVIAVLGVALVKVLS